MTINFSDTVTAVDADLNRRSSTLIIILFFLLLFWMIWVVFMPLPIVKHLRGVVAASQFHVPEAIEDSNQKLSEPSIMSQSDDLVSSQTVQQTDVEKSRKNSISKSGLQMKLLFEWVSVQDHLTVGQSAKLLIEHPQHNEMRAIVTHMGEQGNGQIEVVFSLELDERKNPLFKPGDEVSVSVSVSKITPWQLLMHSLGQELNHSY